jgi:hypothetical protein
VKAPPKKPAGMPLSKKMLIPEYAIGHNFITQAEYDQLRDGYLAQSQACFSVVAPLLILLVVLDVHQFSVHPPRRDDWWPMASLLVFGGAWGTLVLLSLWSLWANVLLPALAGLALIAGFDRLHKYNGALQALIIGSFDAKVEAKTDQKSKPTPPTPFDQAVSTLDHKVKRLQTLVHDRELIERLEKKIDQLSSQIGQPTETDQAEAQQGS